MTVALALPDPYEFVRVVTASMAAFWTLRGTVVAWRLLRLLERKLEPDRVERAWLRGVVLTALARTTVLDPLNLALMLGLVALWTAGP